MAWSMDIDGRCGQVGAPRSVRGRCGCGACAGSAKKRVEACLIVLAARIPMEEENDGME